MLICFYPKSRLITTDRFWTPTKYCRTSTLSFVLFLHSIIRFHAPCSALTVNAWVVCKLFTFAVYGGGRTDVDLLRAERRHSGSEWCLLLRLPPSQSIAHRQRRPTCTPSLGAEWAHHRAAELNSMIICEYMQGPSVHRGHMPAQSPRWGWWGAHWGRGHRHWCLLMLILVHLISIPLMETS